MTQFHISPGVYITERDLSVTTGSVSTTEAALAGVFRWGQINTPILIDSESTLVTNFGTPSDLNAETFFTAASYLSYAKPLRIIRAANTVGNSTNITNTVTNAVTVNSNTTVSNTILLNSIVTNDTEIIGKNWDTSTPFVAKWGGSLGNSLKVSVCHSANQYSQTISLAPNTSINSAQTGISFSIGSNTATVLIVSGVGGTAVDTLSVANTVMNSLTIGDNIKAGNTTIGNQYLKITGISTPVNTNTTNATFTINFDRSYNMSSDVTNSSIERYWEFFTAVNKPPSTSTYQKNYGANNTVVDEIHIVVVDEDGLFSGIPNTILEIFDAKSRNSDALSPNGSTLFYKNAINTTSKYIWAASDLSTAPVGNSNTITNTTSSKPLTYSFVGGQDGQNESEVPLSVLTTAYDTISNPEEYEIGAIMQGKARDGINGTALANYLINNIAEIRKDCIVCISPESTDVIGNPNTIPDRVVEFRNSLTSTSYGTLDSGYKYMYDRYNNVTRFIPLNGDIAGAMSRTDYDYDPWVSPAGTSRGIIKNVIKLAWNPTLAQRDILYKNDINPVVKISGVGNVLYGDKTILGKDSAFNKINVRKLFIVVEKAIARYSASLLWEFNNGRTQTQFVNSIEPYLRDIQGRGGISSFMVVAGSTVNTPEVIDSGGFVGNILIAPARSIDKVQLNFIATKTGVNFDEIITSI